VTNESNCYNSGKWARKINLRVEHHVN